VTNSLALQIAPTCDRLIRGFYQGAAGNCASIAIIKAALMAFGDRPILRSVHETAEGYVAVMRDSDREYRLAREEVDASRGLSRFQGEDRELLDHAIFLFTAMAKRAQMEGNDGRSGMTFAEAAGTLNDGEYWLRGPQWLGLDRFVVQGPNRRLPASSAAKRFLEQHAAGIGKDWAHTWFASYGVHDHRGTPGRPPRLISGAIAIEVPTSLSA
jgi:hypothetical protein